MQFLIKLQTLYKWYDTIGRHLKIPDIRKKSSKYVNITIRLPASSSSGTILNCVTNVNYIDCILYSDAKNKYENHDHEKNMNDR